MPLVPFASLPDDARLWIFAADRPLRGSESESLQRDVEAYLAQWEAHGAPLTCAAEWRDSRFLTIAVDQSSAGASGCSIDALYRILQRFERALGVTLMPGARVFYRDAAGAVHGVDRSTFRALARGGALVASTPVFDTTLTELGSYRGRFERPMEESWHAQLAR